MAKEIYTHVNSIDFDFDEAKQACLEELNAFDETMTLEDVSDWMVYDHIARENNYRWDDLKWVINTYPELQFGTWVFAGDVQNWTGTRKGFKTSTNFWNDLCDLGDDFNITSEDGHLKIHAIHHDGGFYGEAKVMTRLGEAFYERWNLDEDDKRSEADVLETIFKSNLFSFLPRLDERL